MCQLMAPAGAIIVRTCRCILHDALLAAARGVPRLSFRIQRSQITYGLWRCGGSAARAQCIRALQPPYTIIPVRIRRPVATGRARYGTQTLLRTGTQWFTGTVLCSYWLSR